MELFTVRIWCVHVSFWIIGILLIVLLKRSAFSADSVKAKNRRHLGLSLKSFQAFLINLDFHFLLNM